MKKAYNLFILVFVLNWGYAQQIDAINSFIEFEIGNMIFSSVEGKITGMSGTVNFDPSNVNNSKFNVCIDPSTVNTDNESRDEHLKNEDFFDITAYTTVCFTSSKVEKTGAGYKTTGKLTLYDTTKEAVIQFVQNGKKLEGTMEINRFDYNLGVKEYDGTKMVDDMVEIKVVCVLK